jgi:hypothetical protein
MGLKKMITLSKEELEKILIIEGVKYKDGSDVFLYDKIEYEDIYSGKVIEDTIKIGCFTTDDSSYHSVTLIGFENESLKFSYNKNGYYVMENGKLISRMF